MGKGSKKLYWAGAGASLLLVVLLALAVIVPRLVDSSWLKEMIQTEVAKQIEWNFDFQKAELSILPSPSVALKQVSLNIPETAQLNLDTIRVYPKLLPLLIGNIVFNYRRSRYQNKNRRKTFHSQLHWKTLSQN
jgi:uncharacterized protein involved in outer membrane biogenesis